jgi:transcriptional regulator GlxA family with amidase domain
MSHHVAFLAFDGFQLLDISGPASVYGAANDVLGQAEYTLFTIATEAPSVRSHCGLSLAASLPTDIDPRKMHSLFLSGGEESGLRALIENETLKDWACRAVPFMRRYGSICSGSVGLAAWGLIGTRRFASHWAAVPRIQSRWPDLNLDPESIFVVDGPLWTSAGVTTGIDMTLAILEQDHGPALARAVAQRLVVSVRRPGWQSQFSPTLAAQGNRDGRYADLIAWIVQNLAKPLGVEVLAEQAGESVRSFQRNFTAISGHPPARFVAMQRLEQARILVVEGQSLKRVAAVCGYGDAGQLSAAFQKRFGMTAGAYRTVHAAL